MLLLSCSKFILVVCCYCCCFTSISVVAEGITSFSEVRALVLIGKQLHDPMKRMRNWFKGDPCNSNWAGVICFDNVSSDGYLHVQELQMIKMNLSGSLSPELGQLSQLYSLNFMWNDLSGSIPKEIGNISNLTLLLLNGNRLTGSLPEELGYLSKLDRLQVDQNNLSGLIPKSFVNLSNLEHLHMNNNSFSGEVPPELSKLPKLLHVLLDNNNLSGHLPPEFASSPLLRIIQLDNNNFNGSEIPSSYGSFHQLVKLSLRNCGLQGTIPDLSSVDTLFYLDLSINNLKGSLPSNLSRNMTTIDLSNNLFNGFIPRSFSNFPNLQRLSLENNLLTGSVPSELWMNFTPKLNSTLVLDLRNNKLLSINGMPTLPVNVTLRLDGNPICSNDIGQNMIQFCKSNVSTVTDTSSSNVTFSCLPQSCPSKDFYEYVSGAPTRCYCALPIILGYRLKSPSFSNFPPYIASFKNYINENLKLQPYQFSIVSYQWEVGPRLRMELKIFPNWEETGRNKFNLTEIKRLRHIFTTWKFPGSQFFGPYELLNFTLVGEYQYLVFGKSRKKLSSHGLVGILIGVVISAIAASALLTLLIARKWGRNWRFLSGKRYYSKTLLLVDGVKAFKYDELSRATDMFSAACEIGKGGYGKVYKGVLSDKKVVAVKRAQVGSLQGEKEFMTEIQLLSRLHHKNLVSLIGYCDEQGEQMLVYEYIENGTLRSWLSGNNNDVTLDFYSRVRIALDAAKGILYLHTEANPPVYHRDIKSTNILLDSNFTAKVSDFGLSRVASVFDDQVYTVVRGTPGYIDPEYLLTDKYSGKSDVYSMGIVFLELLTGLLPISHGKNIVREVNIMLKSGTMFSVVDAAMGTYPLQAVERFANLGLRCCRETAEKRPSMQDVVWELESVARISSSDTATSVGGSRPAAESEASSSSFYADMDIFASSGASMSDNFPSPR